MSIGTKWSWIIWLIFIGLFVVTALIFVGENIIADIILKIILTLIIYYIVKIFFSILNPHKKLKNRRIRKKKMSKDFLQLYDYVKKEHGKELEEDRKKVIKVIVIISIILTIILLFDIIFFIYVTTSFWKFMIMPFFIGLIIGEIQYSKVNKKYNTNYKDNIIRNFIEYINPRLEYRIHGEEDLYNAYLKAGFDAKRFGNFKSDDYIKGINKDRTRIEIANIVCGNMNEKGDIPGYNDKPKFYEIFYEGIFSITDLNYNLQKEIKIKKNKKTLKKIKNKVKLDNSEFEKYFDVYADSEILALGLIGHAIMEQMIIFYEEFKVDFEVIIKDNKIYMRFDTGMMFEPNILKKSYNMKTLWLYYNILIFVTEITLRLNELAKDLNLEV